MKEIINKRAYFELNVQETVEAGLVLTGSEIKSIRAGRAQLTGSFVRLLKGKKSEGGLSEPVVVGLHLGEASEPARSRRLLLNGREIKLLEEQLQIKGKAAVPLKIYSKHGWAKLLIGVGSGRKSYNKRELLKSRDISRQQERELKGR